MASRAQASKAGATVMTAEQMVMDQLVRAHFTDEKIAEMAGKMGPVIEKQLMESVKAYFEDNSGEIMWDVMNKLDMSKFLASMLAEKLGLPIKKSR